MLEMRKAKVLISGMRGVGVEIAKNVILAGVRAVTVHDVTKTAVGDLSSQYYLKEQDVGKNRAECCWEKLAELNPEVTVTFHSKPLSNEFVSGFNVVVLTESSTEEIQTVGDFCHNNKIKFVVAQTAGIFGMIFNDFGEKFEVGDHNGEDPLSAMIASISNGAEGEVTCLDESRHGFEDGDWVVFKEVEGMNEINGKEFKIIITGPYTFKIGDTSSFSPYKTKGIVTQVKKPKLVDFKPYSEAVKDPEILIADFAKFSYPKQLHFAFQAMDKFKSHKNRKPMSYNKEEAKEFSEMTSKIAGADEELDSKLLNLFSFTCDGDVCPMNGVIGGVAAQEVIKACTGKYMPIFQWFYFDAVECLPNFGEALSEKTCVSTNSRYDGQIKVFGSDMQKKLSDSNVFIVGAGAIGCEHLKNFSMMGIASGGKGKLTITDMDTIETSNLNRQFLFRKEDVKSEKSTVAARAAKGFNPALNIESKFEKVGPETEGEFGDDFFEGLDFVANALDNIVAREYMDRRCVYYRKPLLESGTLGSKGNTQVVIPDITESYSSSRDPPETSFPICTIKNFPHEIAHTLQWAREEFESMFSTPFFTAAQLSEAKSNQGDVSALFEQLKKQAASQCKETLMQLKKVLKERPSSFQDCVKWARDCWLERFHNQIAQLLHSFPPDKKASSGADFWSPPKRCPHALELDLNSQYHIEYITSAALLRAENFNIKSESDCRTSKAQFEKTLDEVRSILSALPAPAAFKPRDDIKIAENDEQLESMNNEAEGEIDKMIDECKMLFNDQSGNKLQIKAIDFEKDDDMNWHIDYITAASNNRATNYSIELADKFKSKKIAGKIIPAIATTTAVMSGLICLEIFKVLNGEKDIEKYKCSFVNLALPYFGFSEPLPPKKAKYNEVEWTQWDRFELSAEQLPTIKDLMDYFDKEMKLEVQMLSYGVSMLYSFFMPPAKQKARQSKSVKDTIEEVTKTPMAPHAKYVVLEVCCEQEGEDVDVPYIKFKVK